MQKKNNEEVKKVLTEYMDELIRLGKERGVRRKKGDIQEEIANKVLLSPALIKKYFGGEIPVERNVDDLLIALKEVSVEAEMKKDTFTRIRKKLLFYYKKDNYNVKHNLLIFEGTDVVEQDDLKKALDNYIGNKQCSGKIFYIQGFRLTGKSTAISRYTQKFLDSESNPFHLIVWIRSFTKDYTQLKNIMIEICKVYGLDETVLKQYGKEKLENECKKIILENKTFLILDLNDICLQADTREFLKFISQYSHIIILSSKALGYNDQQEENWKYILFSMNQGLKYNEFLDLLRKKKNADKLLNKRNKGILYSITDGIPNLVNFIYQRIEKLSISGIRTEEILEEYNNFSDKNKLDEQGYDILTQKIISDTWNLSSVLMKEIFFCVACFPDSVAMDVIAYICGKDRSSDEWIHAKTECINTLLIQISNSSRVRFMMSRVISNLILCNCQDNPDYCIENVYKKAIEFYLSFTQNIGFCYDEIEKLQPLFEAGEAEYNIIAEILNKCEEYKQYFEFCEIVRNLKYYIYINGHWDTSEESWQIRRANCAHLLADYSQELEALAANINMAAKQKNELNASIYLDRADSLLDEKNSDIDTRTKKYLRHAKALYFYCCESNLTKALELWEDNIKDKKGFGNDKLGQHDYMSNQRWYQKALYKSGKVTAKEMCEKYKTCYKEAENVHFIRAMIDYKIQISRIYIDLFLNERKKEYLDNALKHIEIAEHLIEDELEIEMKYQADCYGVRGLIELCKTEDATNIWNIAIDLYSQLQCYNEIEILSVKKAEINFLLGRKND